MIEKLDQKTPNFTDEHIANIAVMFPHCVTEVEDENGRLKKAIDFDLLKQELTDNIVDGPKERYRLEWPGKRASLIAANTPITKTLRPAVDESVDFDTTQNLYIEGDNLEALKLLQESYLGAIKMIYIDPPYNTGKDFVYKDNFTRSKEEELQESGQVDGEGGRLVANLESNGRFHSDWMSMMYSRLRLARNLLKDDGVIFISIDDNEVHNLHKLCDEIFGENNFVGELPTIMNLKGNADAYGFSSTHEYTLVYTKDKNNCTFGHLDVSEDELEKWNEDEWGLYKKADTLKRTGQDASRESRPKGWFPVFITDDNHVYVTYDDKPHNENDTVLFPVNDDGDELSWSWGKKKIIDEPYNLIVINGRNGKNIYKKQRPSLGNLPTKKPKSSLYASGYSTSTATTQLKNLLGKKLFDGPKPVPLLQDFIQIATNTNSIILDFFAGSSTTAHAVMELNAKDNGNRKFIMVQLPEETDEKSEAYKAGYKTIAEIGKERIRRAGKKIKEENAGKEGIEDLDIGFRVLKIDSSNMKDIYFSPDVVDKESLFDTVDHIKEDRTAEDLLFGVLVDWGVDLTLPIRREEILGKTVFFVGEDALTACFDEELDEAFFKELATRDALRVVFKESGFKDDETKINAEQIFKQLAPGSDLRVI